MQYRDDGTILYHQEKKVYEWQTDDGSDVRKTAHQVTIPGGHSYTAYDYEIEQVPGTSQAVLLYHGDRSHAFRVSSCGEICVGRRAGSLRLYSGSTGLCTSP